MFIHLRQLAGGTGGMTKMHGVFGQMHFLIDACFNPNIGSTAPLPDAADAVAPSFIAGIILAFIAGIAAPLFIAGIAGTGMTPSLTDAADAAAPSFITGIAGTGMTPPLTDAADAAAPSFIAGIAGTGMTPPLTGAFESRLDPNICLNVKYPRTFWALFRFDERPGICLRRRYTKRNFLVEKISPFVM